MKVQIGSKYQGVPFDRPALRQMPKGWVLEESKPVHHPPSPEFWIGVLVIIGWLFVIAQTFMDWLK